MPIDPADEITARYDREAQVYRDDWAPILRRAGQVLLPELQGEDVRSVLDVGAGVWSLLPDLRSAFPGAFVVGIDRSRGMLALAPREASRAVMDAMRLGLASASFDRLLMAFMLFHLESPLSGLREARRVLRAGGFVGTLTWAGDLESNAIRHWNECLEQYGAVPTDAVAAARHDAVDTPGKMEVLLRNAGFRSPRSWVAELVTTIEIPHLLRLKTGLGAAKRRFDSLASPAREACLAEARGRWSRLASEDHVARVNVVYSVARA